MRMMHTINCRCPSPTHTCTTLHTRLVVLYTCVRLRLLYIVIDHVKVKVQRLKFKAKSTYTTKMMIITMTTMTMTATTATTAPEITPTLLCATGSGSMVKCHDDVTVMSCDMVIGGTERVNCITKHNEHFYIQ